MEQSPIYKIQHQGFFHSPLHCNDNYILQLEHKDVSSITHLRAGPTQPDDRVRKWL